MVVQHHAVGVSQQQGHGDWSELREGWMQQIQRGPGRKAAAEVSDLSLERRFTFQHDNDLKHPAKTTLEQLQDKSLTVPEWSNQSLDLNPTEHLRRDLKMEFRRFHPI
ncbi:hypothetical protein LDENG_00157500 [Lucifuga dentata]|nr:hypothetical protein LDENG_00157500 [Lucifuga dentata]